MHDPSASLTVLLADDHPVAREGLRRVLECRREFVVVAEASDGRQAMEKVIACEPDLAVLDLNMPIMSGLAATRQICADFRTKVVLITAHDGAEYVREGLAAGARGYVPKFAPPNDILEALRAVGCGKTYVHPTLADRLIRPLAVKGGTAADDLELLSAREEETLRLIARGFSNAEISEMLKIGVKTVETYKDRGTQKLGIRSRPQLMQFAVRRGWLQAREFENAQDESSGRNGS